MEVPEGATRGILWSYRTGRQEEEISFFIHEREEDGVTIRVRWEKPCFYCIRLEDGDYMPRYNNLEGILTKRKNGKWMFKGHQRLYSFQEVKFY